MKLHQDVQEVSLLAMVHFLIIWPIMCVVVYRVKRQGKSMTYYRAIQIISSVLIILMAIVFGCLYQYVVKPNAYQVLQVGLFLHILLNTNTSTRFRVSIPSTNEPKRTTN